MVRMDCRKLVFLNAAFTTVTVSGYLSAIAVPLDGTDRSMEGWLMQGHTFMI